MITRLALHAAIGLWLMVLLAAVMPDTAQAQIYINPGAGGDPGEDTPICFDNTGLVVLPLNGNDCDDDLPSVATSLSFGPTGQQTILRSDGTVVVANTATFNGTAVFNGDAVFNGGAAYSGAITAAGIVSTNGFTNTGGFTNNGSGTFTGGLTANTINAAGGYFSGPLVSNQLTTGAINASTLFTTGGATVSGFFTANNGASILGTTQLQTARISQNLTVLNGATVNMGGNRVQNVGGPVDATDATNKDYVDSAVAQTNAVNARQDQELTDIRTVNARQDQELGDVRAVNTQQASQISAVETANTRQDQELTQVRAVNSTQADQIAALQALDAQQGQQIVALQVGQAALLGMIDETRRELEETNEGVAMGLAMESPALPPGANFALSGGVGYFGDRSAVTTAITTRISPNASFSAGVGVGLNSGKFGARGGFQIAW